MKFKMPQPFLKKDPASLAGLIEELRRYLDQNIAREIDSVLSQLRLEDNFDGTILRVSDTGPANTEFSVSHPIKRTPNYFIVIDNDTAGTIIRGGTAWTATAIYLIHSGAGADISVFVW